MKAAAILFAIALVMWVAVIMLRDNRAHGQDCELGAWGCQHHENHGEYQGWRAKNGGGCCNGEDCRPVRARPDGDGGWSIWVPEFREWLPVPDYAVGAPDKFKDGRSHACTSKPGKSWPSAFHIFCFSGTGSKS